MGSQTAKLQLPYPVGTDRVMDGDNAIQALAETVETSIIPAWTQIPWISGWTNYPAWNEPGQWRKKGDKVELRGLAYSVNGTANGNWLIDLTGAGATWAQPTTDIHLTTLGIDGDFGAQILCRLDIHTAGGNAWKLTYEHNTTAMTASSIVLLNGVYWFVAT